MEKYLEKAPNYLPDDVAQLVEADKQYRIGTPVMKDHEYDQLEQQCLLRYPEYRDMITVLRDELCGDDRDVLHLIPMGSLEKTPNIELWDSGKRNNGDRFVSEKIDGASLELVYMNGKLARAVTRGDGTKGMDVTPNAMLCPEIPSEIGTDKLVVVRGEICMSWTAMNELNDRLQEGEDPLRHPRNATVGILRADKHANRMRYLSFRAFDMHIEQNEVGELEPLYNMELTYQALQQAGFRVPYHQVVYRIQSQLGGIEPVVGDVIIHENDIPKDGAVVTMYDVLDREMYGYSEDGKNCPLGSIAVKTGDVAQQTKLLDIEWSPGRNKLSPVAVVSPVEFEGAVVERVHMKSYDWIRQTDVRVGDTLSLVRSGGVIPKIVSEGAVDRDHDNPRVTPPIECPCCERDTVVISGANAQCGEPQTCEGVQARRMENACKQLGIKGFAYKTLFLMAKQGVTFNMLFDPERHDEVEELAGDVAPKIWQRVKQQIETKHPYDAKRYLAALGIEGLGHNTIEALWDEYTALPDAKELHRMTAIDWGDLTVRSRKIGHSVGWNIAQGIQTYLEADKWDSMTRLQEPKLRPEVVKHMGSELSTFPYRHICLTGKPAVKDWIPRKDITALLQKADCEVHSSVSGDVECLVQGDPNSQSSKSKKAHAKGLPVMSYEDLFDLMKENEHVKGVAEANIPGW